MRSLKNWKAGFFAFCAGALVAGASGEELSPELKKRLDAQGFVVTDQTYKQGFSAYLKGKPAFITSDSLLMAYTTLLERVVGEQQLALMGGQIEWVVEMVRHLPKASEKREGVREVRLLMGSAYRILIGTLPKGMTEEEGKLIEVEAKRVEKAEGMAPPGWWGSTQYLPYSRFVPTSTWDESEPMRRYFRYYQWMQSLPLDHENERHVKICEEVYRALEKCDYEIKNYALNATYTGVENEGVLHDLDEIGYINLETNAEALTLKVREVLAEKSRLISPESTPDKAVIDEQLGRSLDLTSLARSVGGSLGSELALAGEGASEESVGLNKGLRESRWRPNELYLKSLIMLNEAVDDRAPKLFHSKAWQRKQLNCTMGGWAEYRHALAITQTTSAFWMGLVRQDPGYVEPVPDFFQTLGTAAEQLAGRSVGNREQKDRFRAYRFAVELENFSEVLREIKKDGRGWPHVLLSPRWKSLSEGMGAFFQKDVVDEFEGQEWNLFYKSDRDQIVPMIEEVCEKFWNQDKAVTKLFKVNAITKKDEVTHRLYRLALLSLRLESLARKQLAGSERNEGEIKLIKYYGKTLGYLMFYEGNSYLTPRDDAPKIVQIAHLGGRGGEQVLQCGVARPRQILVRYPNRKGEFILCQGAVYSYRERIGKKVISDLEWRKVCGETSAPKWMQE